jgi:hypothetical protein
MVRHEISIDDETDRILASLTAAGQGELSQVIADLVHAHEGLQQFADQCEQNAREELLVQLERSESDFQQGKFTEWSEVKRQNGL